MSPQRRDEWNGDNRWLLIAIVAGLLLWFSFNRVSAQIVSANPLEYVALAEGNELINAQVKAEIEEEQKTALLQNTIAAEFTQIRKWEKKYNSYIKEASGYASTLKACTTLYDDGVRIFLNLCSLKKAISDNPGGIVATISMNNLFIETATELVTTFNMLKEAVAKGGKENMLTGAERSKTLWALNDRLNAFNKKLTKLCYCIRMYTMNDVWNNAITGIIDKSTGDIADEAFKRWKRAVPTVTSSGGS